MQSSIGVRLVIGSAGLDSLFTIALAPPAHHPATTLTAAAIAQVVSSTYLPFNQTILISLAMPVTEIK